MNTINKNSKLCKKIIFQEAHNSPTKLLCIITSDLDPTFLKIRTKNRDYQISRTSIISISDTDILFDGVIDDEQ